MGQKHREDVLVAYMSDGWGSMLRNQTTCQIQGHRVKRRGKFRHEFGLQRSFAKTLSATGVPEVTTMMSSEPIAMRHGRTAMHFFTLACEFMVDGCYSAKELHGLTLKCALISGAYNLR